MLSNLKKYHIILASKSPRRQELLRGMGVDFEILTKETPENYPADLPLDEVPKYLSLQKSLAFNDDELPADYLLITSDTVVICEGEILGKPKNREDATRMLQLLSGKTHHVVTGVTVRSAKKTESFAVHRLLHRALQTLRQGGCLRYPGVDWLCGYQRIGRLVLQRDGPANPKIVPMLERLLNGICFAKKSLKI